MAAAYAAHAERSIRAIPQPPALPTAVWINPPASWSGRHQAADDLTQLRAVPPPRRPYCEASQAGSAGSMPLRFSA
jgi:hypothetical protein